MAIISVVGSSLTYTLHNRQQHIDYSRAIELAGSEGMTGMEAGPRAMSGEPAAKGDAQQLS